MKIRATILILLTALSLKAQQQPQYSQYMLNQYVLNPAVGGTEDYAMLAASFRTQWLGMENAPQSYYLSGHLPIGKVLGDYSKAYQKKVPNYHGAGLVIYGDKTGPTRQQSFLLSYSYNLRLNNNFRLAAGLFFGVKQFTINTNEIDFHDPGDPTASGGGINKLSPDASIGLWGYSDIYFVGLATNHLFNNSLSSLPDIDKKFESQLNRHYFLTAGIKLQASESVYVVPSFLVKYVSPTPISVDLNAKAVFNDQYWLGVTLRTADGFGVLAGINFAKNWGVGYSYEYTVSKLRSFQTGSHEIVLNYRLPLGGTVICPNKFW